MTSTNRDMSILIFKELKYGATRSARKWLGQDKKQVGCWLGWNRFFYVAAAIESCRVHRFLARVPPKLSFRLLHQPNPRTCSAVCPYRSPPPKRPGTHALFLSRRQCAYGLRSRGVSRVVIGPDATCGPREFGRRATGRSDPRGENATGGFNPVLLSFCHVRRDASRTGGSFRFSVCYFG